MAWSRMVVIVAVNGYLLCHILHRVTNYPLFTELISACGVLILVGVALSAPKRSLLLPSLLLLISCAVIWGSDHDLNILWQGLQELRDVFVMVLFASWIGWVITYRPYINLVIQVMHRVLPTNSLKYFGMTALTNLVSSFMLHAGMMVMYDALKNQRHESFPGPLWEKVLSTSIVRGFSLIILWSVFNPAFSYGIQGMGAPTLRTILLGIILVMVAIVLDFLLFICQTRFSAHFAAHQKQSMMKRQPAFDGHLWPLLFEFSAVFVVVFLLTFALYMTTRFNILTIVPIGIVCTTLLYFVYQRDVSSLFKHVRNFVTQDVFLKKGELTLILAAGLLVAALKYTDTGSTLLFQYLNLLNIDPLLSLTLIMIVLGLFGMPPNAVIVIVVGVVGGVSLGYPPELIVLALLSGGFIALLIAPVSIPLLLMSGLNKQSTYKNGFYWNYLFAILFLLISQLYLIVLK